MRARLRCVGESWVAHFAVGASLILAAPLTAQAPPRPDSAVTRWARTMAIALPSMDEPYRDSAFAFLRGLVGDARILALGEPVHGGHEPLAFRNHVIRYAVTRLGFTAVALESGLTEGMVTDDFILGGAGDLDSVVRRGFTWDFQYLPENRELVRWLREHNAHAARKVHFYGIDLTGGDDVGAYPGASRAVHAALDDLESVTPAAGADLRARLVPMMDRFLPARHAEYSSADRERLGAALEGLYQALLTASRHPGTRTALRSGRALRNAWMAVRLNEVMAVFGAKGSSAGAILRDSAMAENTRWALEQEGERGRLVLFAHDAHVMNARFVYPVPPYAGSWKTQGQYLRSWFGTSLVVVGSAASRITGNVSGATGWVEAGGETQAGLATFTAELAKVRLSLFVLDLRAGDRVPGVGAALERAWPFEFLIGSQPLSPRQTFDAMVYFDRVTASKRMR